MTKYSVSPQWGFTLTYHAHLRNIGKYLAITLTSNKELIDNYLSINIKFLTLIQHQILIVGIF